MLPIILKVRLTIMASVGWSAAVSPVPLPAEAVATLFAGHTATPVEVSLYDENEHQHGRVAIWRDGFMPTFRSLEHLESIGLRMARDGRRFGEICTAIVDLVGPGDGLRTAGEFLAEWMRSGIIRSIES